MLTLVNGTIWQYNTCLEHGGGEAGLGPDTLHNLPVQNTPYVENILFRLGAWDDLLFYGEEGYEHPTDLLMRQYLVETRRDSSTLLTRAWRNTGRIPRSRRAGRPIRI